jgi:hypothetical protein
VLDLQAISDRLEITDVLIRYGTALDTRDWELVATCFTVDAILDYDAFGRVTVGQFTDQAKGGLGLMPASQHTVTNIAIEVDGDRATCRSYASAMHVRPPAEGNKTYLLGGVYTDILERTPEGWKIANRTFRSSWATVEVNRLDEDHSGIRS